MDQRSQCERQNCKTLRKQMEISVLTSASGFLDVTPKAKGPTEKDKLDLLKIKVFYAAKGTIKEVKANPQNENICKLYI